ncbi:MAG: tetratricopeptide repeat protein [Phycisphaerales bacterium]
MMIGRNMPARCARFASVGIVIAALAATCLSTFAQSVPNDPEALRRLMEQKKQQREAADKAGSQNPTDDKTKSARDKAIERQRDILNRNADAIAKLREQIATGKHREAFGDLMQFRQLLGEPRVPGIEAMAAEIALLENRPDQAWRFIQSWATPTETYDRSAFRAYLLAGETLLAQNKPDAALAVLDWLTMRETDAATPGSSGDSGGSIDVVRAAEATGRALTALKKYQDSIDAFKFAQSYARAQLANYLNESPLKELLAKVQQGLESAQRSLDLKEFGRAFVRFRDAEILRKQKQDYQAALAVYQEVIDKNRKWYREESEIADPDSDAQQIFAQLQQLPPTSEIRNPFVEASRLYAGICLAELGRTAEAVKTFRGFAEEEPRLGLYKGEAWLELGRIAIERQFNPQEAGKYLQKCDDWLAEVRQQERAPQKNAYSIVLELPGVRKKATEQIKPPEEERRRDFWGNIKKNPIEPGELVNRKTCPWYLDDLEEQCAKFRGFLAFAGGNLPGATEQWNRIPKLDATNTDAGDLRTNPNDYHRLMFGVEHGYLYAYPQDLTLYEGRQKFAVLLGDFYYVTRQFDKAVEICGRLLQNNKDLGRLNLAQQDYVHYLCGSAIYRGKWKAMGDSGDLAIVEMEQVLAHKDKTMSEPRAMMTIANLGRRSRKPELRDRAMSMLQTLAADTGYGRYTYIARIEMGRDLVKRGNREEGYKWLRSVPKSEKAYHAIAEYLLAQFEQKKK